MPLASMRPGPLVDVAVLVPRFLRMDAGIIGGVLATADSLPVLGLMPSLNGRVPALSER